MPSEVVVEFRGSIEEYMQGTREEIPPILTSLAQAVVQTAIPKTPHAGRGRIGASLIAIPTRPIGPDIWESAIDSTEANLVRWHEFGTGIHAEKAAKRRIPITATRPHRMLVFEKEGKTRFIRGRAGEPARVMHPGVPARGFLRAAIRQQLPIYMEMFERIGIRRPMVSWG